MLRCRRTRRPHLSQRRPRSLKKSCASGRTGRKCSRIFTDARSDNDCKTITFHHKNIFFGLSPRQVYTHVHTPPARFTNTQMHLLLCDVLIRHFVRTSNFDGHSGVCIWVEFQWNGMDFLSSIRIFEPRFSMCFCFFLEDFIAITKTWYCVLSSGCESAQRPLLHPRRGGEGARMNASTRMIMTQWTPKAALKAIAHVLIAASVISLMCGGTSLYVVDAMRVLAQPDMDSDAMIAEVGTFHTTEKHKKHNTPPSVAETEFLMPGLTLYPPFSNRQKINRLTRSSLPC